ncbi:MAG: DUF177 domain-containing protein [Ilumatobacteraceae bacterium]
MGRSLLTLNAVELLRQPGTRRPIQVVVDLEALDIHDDRLDGEVVVDVVAESTLGDIVVAGTLGVGWHDTCRRCVRPLSGPLVVDVAERYAIPGDSADPDAFPIENGQLDLGPMVREGVLLAAPDAPLCREDCAGLCPSCGADLNDGPCGCDMTVRDDRWSVLDQLELED